MRLNKYAKRKCEKCKNKLQVKKEKFNVLDLLCTGNKMVTRPMAIGPYQAIMN